MKGFGATVPIVIACIVLLSFFNARQSRVSTCASIEHLKAGFVQQLERGRMNLDRFAYYREHPNEKLLVLKEINAQIRSYAPIACH